jgi:hypothetical protein
VGGVRKAEARDGSSVRHQQEPANHTAAHDNADSPVVPANDFDAASSPSPHPFDRRHLQLICGRHADSRCQQEFNSRCCGSCGSCIGRSCHSSMTLRLSSSRYARFRKLSPDWLDVSDHKNGGNVGRCTLLCAALFAFSTTGRFRYLLLYIFRAAIYCFSTSTGNVLFGTRN